MSPRSKTKAAKRSPESKVTVERKEEKSGNFLDKIQTDLEKNQSYLNLILGALIVIVLGVLIFNYFNKPSEQPGDVTEQAEQTTDEQGDVTKAGLPGKYTVKEGDTLFSIAQKYYDDGGLYTEILKQNNLTSDSIETGQELTIPKVATAVSPSSSPEGSPSASPSVSPSPNESVAPSPSQSPEARESAVPAQAGEKGAAIQPQTTWGDSISGDSYTVVKGDWLSTIAGRAYGDIMKYDTIAKANNIANPNVIEVGTVLKIPRD